MFINTDQSLSIFTGFQVEEADPNGTLEPQKEEPWLTGPLSGLKCNCVTEIPDMRSEKVMVRLAPWKRSMECMREGRWNRVLDLKWK